MIKTVLGAGAASLLLVAGAAAAETPFDLCDGYLAPLRADNITSESGSFQGRWVMLADVRRYQSLFGAEAIPHCDAALRNPLLLPKFWLRRGHLLQAKAMHQILSGDASGALETLAASDAVGVENNDVAYTESAGLANRALRAMAYYKLGRRAEAAAELDAIDAGRPYAVDIRRLSRAIRFANEPDLELKRRLLLASVPTDPDALLELFWLATEQGEFAQMTSLAPQIILELPSGRLPFEDEAERRNEQIEIRAELAGATAYAFAALGQDDKASAMIADTRLDIRGAAGAAAGQSLGPNGEKAMKTLDRWVAAIDLMRRAPGMTLDALTAATQSAGVTNNPVFRHIVSRLPAGSGPEATARSELLATLDARRDQEIAQWSSLTPTGLVALLPRPEREKMRPNYRRGGEGYFRTEAGFNIQRSPDSPYISVNYITMVSTIAVAHELALFAAAKQARAMGKDSILVASRILVSRTLDVQRFGGSNVHPNGYEARLRILPVNAAELPPELEHSRWRLLRVADVLGDLDPRYGEKPRR